MKYKHIEASREVRLWIGQVIVPAVVGGLMIFSNPEAREWVGDKASAAKTAIKNKFHR